MTLYEFVLRLSLAFIPGAAIGFCDFTGTFLTGSICRLYRGKSSAFGQAVWW